MDKIIKDAETQQKLESLLNFLRQRIASCVIESLMFSLISKW